MLSTRSNLIILVVFVIWLLTGEPARPQIAAADGSSQLTQVSPAESVHRQLLSFDQELDLSMTRFERNGCGDARRQIERAQERFEHLESELHRLPRAMAEPLRNKLSMLRNRVRDLRTAAEQGGVFRPAPRGKAVSGGAQHRGSGAPPNDDCADAVVIGTGTFFGDTSRATNDGETSCGSSLFSPDVWFRLVFPETGTLFVDTFGSTYDTVLSVHSECPGTVGNTLACDDDSSGLDSAVGVLATAGTELLIRVSGFGDEAGAFTLHVGAGGEIAGTVTEAVTGDPLADTVVDLWDGDGYFAAWTSTDSGGGYALGGLAPGVYFASTRNDLGFLDELYDDLLCPGGDCDPTVGTPILVENDTTTVDIDFALDRGGTIAGNVVDASTGEGAAGARVEIWDSAGSFVQSVLTGDSGDYAIDGLAPGTYFANTDTSDFADELYDDLPCPGGAPGGCDPTSGTPIAVVVDTTTSGISFVLDRMGTVTGTVIETSTGDPVTSGRVEIWNGAGSYMGGDFTDTSGAYSVGGLTTGSYFVVAEDYQHVDELYDDIPCPGGAGFGCDPVTGTPVEVEVNGTVSGIDFVLDRLGAVSGTVTEVVVTGDPIASIRVELWSSSGSFVGSDYTDVAGVYTVERVAAGTYFAATDDNDYVNELFDDLPCPGGAPSGCDPATGTPIAVELNATTSGIDFALVREGTISGVVTDDATGDPISGARVEIWNVDNYRVWSGNTDGSGAYSTQGLAAGTYYAVTDLYSSDYFDELYDELPCPHGGCQPTSGTPIEVADGSITAGIDFTLTLGGAVSGTVTDQSTGDPITYGYVRIADASGDLVGSDYLDSSGYYRVGGLAAGTYYASTDINGNNHLDELWDDLPCPNGACDPTAGTPIEVSLGETTAGVDFALERQGAISGTVTDAVTGQPITSGYVRVYDAGGSYVDDRYLNSAGSYTVNGLAAGTYFARTDIYSSNYVDELYDDLLCQESCTPTTGTPIEVSLNSTTSGIDFALDRRGAISGIVTDASTGGTIAGIRVRIWSSGGDYEADDYTDVTGRYTAGRLFPGVYYATTDSQDYDDELFDDLPCAGGCDPTQGAPIQVATNTTTRHVDFALNRAGSISGTVTQAATGQPISGLRVRIWNATGSSATYVDTDAVGNYTAGGLGAGVYFATTDNYDYLDQLYDGLPCAGCDPTSGTPIQVSANADTPGIDFALDRLGAIIGTVTDVATGAPISNLRVRIWDQDGNSVAWDYTDGLGSYVFNRLLPGTFFATTDDSDYLDELFDDLPCTGGCDVTAGTPIAVLLNQTTGPVDFALDRLGAVSGTVVEASTGQGASSIKVEIWDADSTFIGSDYTDSAGSYLVGRLAPGTYFATTENFQDYLDELYDDLPCLAGAPAGCDPDKGTPIPVASGVTTGGIDFELISATTGISGVVTEAASGEPLANVIIDIWDGAGLHVTSAVSAPSGAYYASLPPDSYYASTDHGLSTLIEEIYDGVLCPGPAFAGLCDPTTGAVIVVEESVMVGVPGVAAGIDFTLEPSLLFQDSFESGSFSGWSLVVGGGP